MEITRRSTRPGVAGSGTPRPPYGTPAKPASVPGADWQQALCPPRKDHPLVTLLATEDRLAPLALPLTLAVVIWPHGAQKLLGWFGGYGFEGTTQGQPGPEEEPQTA